jgi:hypothetical protein
MARSVSVGNSSLSSLGALILYYHDHVSWFEHLTDQRALGMSMRVERASLEQVGHLAFCVVYLHLHLKVSSCIYIII